MYVLLELFSVMFVNIFILGCGGFLFGWNQAIYSIFAYFLAYKAIVFTLEFKSKKMIWICSERHRELVQVLIQEFNGDIQFLNQESSPAIQDGQDLFFILSGKNIKKLKSIVYDFDPAAHVAVSRANGSPETSI